MDLMVRTISLLSPASCPCVFYFVVLFVLMHYADGKEGLPDGLLLQFADQSCDMCSSHVKCIIVM